MLVAVVASLCLTGVPSSLAQPSLSIVQQAYLKASNTGASDFLGQSVAVSGDTVVIGAPNESSNATGVNGNQNDNSAEWSGAAYVFVRNGTNWIQQAYLKASNTGANDQFGLSVSVSGDTVVVGAAREDSNATGVNGNQANNSADTSGAAYVFVRNGTNWSQQAYLKSPNTRQYDFFGVSVAVSGDTIVAGALYDGNTGIFGSGPGAAYVFVRNGTNWTPQARLRASNAGGSVGGWAGDEFGWTVAVSGDTVVVGAIGEDSDATGVNGTGSDPMPDFNSGAAYVFARSGTNWTQQAYLKASNTGFQDRFGWSVSVSEDTVVVGAISESSNATGVNGDQNDDSAIYSGAAYVFARSGTNWIQQAYLKASNTESGDSFGWSVAVSGGIVVVGAVEENSSATGVNGNQSDTNAPGAGATYVFTRDGTNWSQQAYLKASNTEANDYFGRSVAVSGDTVVMGAPQEASNATGVNGDQSNNSLQWAGAAYVFTGVGVPTGPTIVTQPTAQQVFTGSNATFTVSATTTNPPLRYQWFFNGADLPGATDDSLTITDAQLPNLGTYQVVVADSAGSVNSAVVSLSLLDALFITTQPADLAVRAGSNATFTVAVYGTGPLHHQWQFNGADVANATNSILTVTNVQAAKLGEYVVVITNQYAAVTSAVAMLTFLTPPTITQPPQPMAVVVGEDATFTVTVTNTATLPVTFQWRKVSTILTNIVLNSRTCSFTLFNVQTNVTVTNGPGSYRVIVMNAANPTGLASPTVALTVLPAVPPAATTLAASGRTMTSATVEATLNPNGATTTGWFEYGLTASYGSSTPAMSAGNGTNALPFTAPITGLMRGTEYHYRVVATNRGGVTLGADAVFQTAFAQYVFSDPVGDILPGDVQDITSVIAGFGRDNLQLTITFDVDTFLRPPHGFFTVFLDTDENPATGTAPPAPFAGTDFRVSYNPNSNALGSAFVFNQVSRQIVGEVSFTFTTNSVSLAVPLALLGGDDGVMNLYLRGGGNFLGPNGPVLAPTDTLGWVGPTAALPELQITGAGEHAQISITGPTNTQWRLESSDTVTGTNAWQPLTNITLGSSPVVVPLPLDATNRFYRGAWLP